MKNGKTSPRIVMKNENAKEAPGMGASANWENKVGRKSAGRVALCGMLITVALMFSYLESFLPVPLPVPGVKLGIANAVTIFCMFTLSVPETVTVSVLRVLLAGLLFQSPVVIVYSLAGAACSIAGMYVLKHLPGFGFVGISVGGAVLHNLGQCAVAAVISGTGNIMWYMSVLLVTGTVAGLAVGLVSGVIVRRVLRSGVSPKKH